MYSIVSISSRACALATDALVLVLTWVKTYHIKREADQAGIKANLTTLVLRDGE